MKPRVLLCYVSTGGNTEKLARALAEEIAPWAEADCRPLSRVREESELLEEADIVGLGSPVFHLRLLHAARRLSRGGATLLGALKVRAPHFYQRQEFPGAQARRETADFAALLRQRWAQPPAQDELLRKLDCQPAKVKLLHAVVPLFASRRLPGLELDASACTGCGLCVRCCPPGAMRITGGLPERDRRRCVHCYQCAEGCPSGALSYDQKRLEEIVAGNLRVLGREQPAHARY